MVKCSPPPQELDAIFSALANSKRRAIVDRLTAGEASMSELAEPLGVSLPALSKHVVVLERAGLLEHHKSGRVRQCRLNPEPIRVADDWLRDRRVFWETRLDSLSRHLAHKEEIR